ncbi:MAG: 4-hydroxy-3-methylbut-2-enyl diphosphate reductase [Oscillospiraceae bacterium]|nr:4-hydroxy-3-methylbut-2-enyl diphosphate reductase [Oscillospiraceae bacterium]
MPKITITIAESAGFCSGVRRAFDMAVAAAQKHGQAYTLGELVHNNDALRILQSKNVFAANSTEDIPAGAVAVIRSHGVGRAVYEQLEQSGIEYYDATCPYVKKIHDIVKDISGIIIIGDENHPEVQGIIGHGNDILAANSPEKLECLLSGELFRRNAQSFVVQTTFNELKWRDCIQIIKKYCTNAKIFDTICKATVKRQRQARELSRNCDVMIVIGSTHSSNSVKLFEICAESCCHTLFIENAQGLASKLSEVLPSPLLAAGAAGITAGASVPAEIIKEVHKTMNEEISKVQDYEAESDYGIDFMAEVEKTLPQKLYTGKRVKAFVVAVNANEVVVDLGVKQSGYIPADEIGGEPGSTPDMIVKPGDEIDCVVTKVNDAEGVVHLSKKAVDSELGYEKLTVAHNADETIEGFVEAIVNSGVIVDYEGSKVFIPASQSGVPRGGDLNTLAKKKVAFKIIEINEQRKRLIGSIRAADRQGNAASRAKFWEEIEIGKKFTGEVKSIENYGVFVDLGGVDGMVHLSELTWKRIKHPRDAVQLGDKLNVFIKAFDFEKKRVSLCAKNPDENPWSKFTEQYHEGDTATATIVNITPFGAFAQIMPGIDGLIHISQISTERVTDVSQAVSIGQEVQVQITEIDEGRERISLSIRALLEPVAAEEGDETAESAEMAESAAE